MASLTEEEKDRCRWHLGYMGTSFGGAGAAPSIAFGIARPVQTAFLLEEAIQNLLVGSYAVDRARRILAALDAIEAKLLAALCTIGVESLGDIKLRGAQAGQTTTDLLEREYVRWAKRLADWLGVPLYPYADRFRGSGPGRNLAVR